MDAELGWMSASEEPFPRLNVKAYDRSPLTARQRSLLDDLLAEDHRLHRALLQAA